MINIMVGLIFVALGTFFALWPRALWWLRWGWTMDREPNRMELVLARAAGATVGVVGLTLALSDYLYRIF